MGAPHRLLMIAMRASPIGSLAGAPQRSSGAARTQGRAAHSRAEVVLEECSSAVDIPRGGYGRGAGALRHLLALVGHALWGQCKPCLVWPVYSSVSEQGLAVVLACLHAIFWRTCS